MSQEQCSSGDFSCFTRKCTKSHNSNVTSNNQMESTVSSGLLIRRRLLHAKMHKKSEFKLGVAYMTSNNKMENTVL